jgi:hypothetical protein
MPVPGEVRLDRRGVVSVERWQGVVVPVPVGVVVVAVVDGVDGGVVLVAVVAVVAVVVAGEIGGVRGLVPVAVWAVVVAVAPAPVVVWAAMTMTIFWIQFIPVTILEKINIGNGNSLSLDNKDFLVELVKWLD